MFIDQAFEKYRPIEEAKLRNFKAWGPKYSDYPEGEDLVGKLIATTRWAAFGGLLWGLGNVVTRPYCKTYTAMAICCIGRILPPVMVTTGFTVTTYYSAKFRKVDDIANYALGGMVAGGVMGCISNSVFNGVLYGSGIAILISLYKMQKLYHPIIIKHPRHYEPYYRRKFDFTFIPQKDSFDAKKV